MGIITWAILGLVAGMLAKAIMPGTQQPSGCLITTFLGMAGAMLGGWLATGLDIGGPIDKINLVNIVTAVIGAVILLGAYQFLQKK